MDEEQEYERFDVENDYDGEWIEDEFLYRSKRRKKAHTQDDAIYGVFADGSDDSDGGGRRRRRRGEDNYGAKPNYSKPVGFVGGGVIAHNGKQEEEPSEDEDDIDRPRGLGLGAGPSSEGLGFSGGGLGFRSAGLGAQPRQAEAEEGEDADEEFLPTAFGRRVAKQAAERRQKEQEEREGRGREGLGQRGGSAPQGGAARPAGDVGTFEAHTKGIGAKLLSKMGWTPGAGLGKEGKGIAKPLEAKLRPKGVGMGYGDRREAQMAPPPKKQDAKQAGAAGPKGAAAVDIRAEAKLWKRKNVEARGRRTFRTAEEILADEEVQGSRAAVERPMVIDMRGPQARVLTNLEHLNVRGEDEEEDSVAGEAMPELQHNVRLLVDIAEADIQRLDARLRQGQDTKAILERERERLAREAQTAAEASARLAEVLAAVSAARKAGEDPSTDSASLCAAYTALRSHHPDEYATYNLAALALAAVLPRLATALKHWAPLDDPDAPAAEFAAWRPLLEHEGRRHGGSLPMTSHGADFLSLSSSSDPYLRLVSEVVLPPLRKDIANRWDPRDAAAMERFMEVWEPLLPAPALGYVTHHLLLPRLRSDVGEWDPLKDPVAPHTWLHPWLPYLGQQMAELWPVVRFKFSAALKQWHPADGSALAILGPWRRVFEPKEWDQLLARAVVPKLAAALAEFVVNPADQSLDAFEWTMAWARVMSSKQMAALLEVHFFPKWHAVLRHWLSSSPDYDEVTRWYLGWKALFPEEVLDTEKVRAQMALALNAMNTAVEGKPLPPTWTHPQQAQQAVPGSTSPQQHPTLEETYGAPHDHAAAAAAAAAAAEELSLRELVERFAEEVGVEFLPKPGRTHEGLQVYHFGLVSCVVDSARGLIRAQLDRAGGAAAPWQATSMEGLLQENERRQKAKRK